VLVAADQSGLVKARQTARALAAMRDISKDQTRLKRFNQEQRDQLEERLKAADERLPQQLAMAYRHLMVLVSDGNGGSRLDVVDLGPARVADTIPGRVSEYLRGSDRLLDTVLAPAALLTDRFGILAAEADAIEIDKLLGYFYRLPRLPKLAGPEVLRSCLVQGVESGTFGLSSGATWDADDSVLRFNTRVEPGEIQFQPGTWLLRASTAKRLSEARTPAAQVDDGSAGRGVDVVIEPEPDGGPPASADPVNPTHVTISVQGVGADKIRDVLKVAVFPLASGGATVSISVEVVADDPSGIPRNTLDLVVLEGLRQLGVEHETS
jgi:hypothetical protein